MRGAWSAAAICGLVAVLGSVLPWVDARDSRPDLDLTATAASSLGDFTYTATDTFPRSAAMVVLVAGLLTALGAMFASWLVTVVSALVGLAVGGLWLGLVASEFDPVGLPWSDFRIGAWLSMGGAVVSLVLGLTMRPRKEEPEFVD